MEDERYSGGLLSLSLSLSLSLYLCTVSLLAKAVRTGPEFETRNPDENWFVGVRATCFDGRTRLLGPGPSGEELDFPPPDLGYALCQPKFSTM